MIGSGHRVAPGGQRHGLDLPGAGTACGGDGVAGQPDPLGVGHGPGQRQRQPGPDRRPQAGLGGRQRPVGLLQQVGLLVVVGGHLEPGHASTQREGGVREVVRAVGGSRPRVPRRATPPALRPCRRRAGGSGPYSTRIGSGPPQAPTVRGRSGPRRPRTRTRPPLRARRAPRPRGSVLAGLVAGRAAPVVREPRCGCAGAIRQRRRDTGVRRARSARAGLHQHFADQRVPETVGARVAADRRERAACLVQKRSHRRVGVLRHCGEQALSIRSSALSAATGAAARRVAHGCPSRATRRRSTSSTPGGTRSAADGPCASSSLATSWTKNGLRPCARAGRARLARTTSGRRRRRPGRPPHPRRWGGQQNPRAGGQVGGLVGDLRQGLQGIVARQVSSSITGRAATASTDRAQHRQRRRVTPGERSFDHHEERIPSRRLRDGHPPPRRREPRVRGSRPSPPPAAAARSR